MKNLRLVLLGHHPETESQHMFEVPSGTLLQLALHALHETEPVSSKVISIAGVSPGGTAHELLPKPDVIAFPDVVAKDAAMLGDKLSALLSDYAGDGGKDEGAAECLTRLLKELDHSRMVQAKLLAEAKAKVAVPGELNKAAAAAPIPAAGAPVPAAPAPPASSGSAGTGPVGTVTKAPSPA